jgi:membrane associated rhomboid family serine protease
MIIIIVIFNIILHILFKDKNIGFSMENANPLNVFLSMFSHKDFYHLFGNMVTFIFSAIFIRNYFTTKQFIILYLISGLFGAYCEIFIFNFLNFQFESEISEVANQYNYKYLNAAPVVGFFYRIYNYDKTNALNKVYYTYHYGAESCIYGMIGSGVYFYFKYLRKDFRELKRTLKKYNKKKKYWKFFFGIAKYGYDVFSIITVIFDLLSKFMTVPWNINKLLNITISEEMKHNSHLGGAVIGFILTIIFNKINKEEEVLCIN